MIDGPDERAEGSGEAALPPADELHPDSLRIGPRVSAVFTAAERAAQDVLTMAQAQAEDIRRRAEAEAATFVQDRHERAEEDARRIVLEAEAEGESIRRAARESAREVEVNARRQEERMREEVTLILDRVDWAREGLDDVVARLDDVLPGRRMPAGAAASAHAGSRGSPGDGANGRATDGGAPPPHSESPPAGEDQA